MTTRCMASASSAASAGSTITAASPATSWERRNAAGDHGEATSQRLEHRQSEPLAERGKNEAGGAAVEVLQGPLIGIAEEVHGPVESERLHLLAEAPSVRGRSISPDDERHRQPPAKHREGVDLELLWFGGR